MRLRTFIFALLAPTLAVAHAATAQAHLPPRPITGGEIHGRLVDSLSGSPIASGSVSLRRAGDSTFIGGSSPDAGGVFRVAGLAPGSYTLRVRAIGYGQLLRSGIVLAADHRVVDLGALTLKPLVAKLSAQNVTAEREDVVLAPDRTSYSTKNMIGASGGTAVDVLRNIPLVEVDGSNRVSLRGSENVVVQINGRSSPLKGEQLGAFLAQLPAGTVKSVEVSTNPSAKNDPEGTAGIINIVLKQDAELGLSGGLSASLSSTGRLWNSSGNVGMQSGPLTLFLSASGYSDHRQTSGDVSRTNLAVPSPAFVETDMRGTEHPANGGGTLRSEYRFTTRNALSFDGFFYGGQYGGENTSRYADLDSRRSVIGVFDQHTMQTSSPSFQDYSAAFRSQGKPAEMQYSSEIEYSSNAYTNDIDLSGTVTQQDASMPAATPAESDHIVGRYPTWNIKSDYTQPLGTHSKLEAGFKGMRRRSSNDFTAAYLDTATGAFMPNTARASAFDYREDIGAGYLLLSQQVARLQAQAGLRLESANTRLDLPTTTQRFTNQYASAFPSAILSYNLTPMRQAKISYSRRISRPGPHQLSPIEYRQDSRNVFRGNPGLRPEYTDAIELGLQDGHAWGSIQLNPYLRRTAHAVRNIQFVDSTGVSVGTYDNVASTIAIGSDLSANVRRGPLMFGGGGSAYRYSSDASNLAGDLSTTATVWSLRANGTWKFSARLDARLSANYRAPYATEGGSQLASVFMNAGVRYKAWGEQGFVSLGAMDPLGLQRYGYRTANGTVIEQSERYFGTRTLYLTVSRNFGQAVKLRPKQPDADGPPMPGTP